MDDLPIVISLDPEPAVTANKKIAAATRVTEETAKKAAQATTSLGEQLARVGRYQQLLADAERKQTAAALGSVRAFDGLTAAIQREQQMLDRIHGPMRQLQQDIEVLNKLQRDGKITAEQHAAALVKSGTAAGVVTKPQGGGADAKGSALARQASERIVGATSVGGFLGGLAGGFVGGNAISLLTQGIGSLIDKWGEHDRAIAVAEKSLRGMFETTGETARAVGDLDRAAAHAGASLKDMTPVYQAVAEASEKWYLTTLDQVNVTEQLANLARKSGREIETATTFIKAFNVATADGAVSSGEFKQLAKTFPEAMNAWAKSLGVSRYELGVLAGQGKVTTREIEAFFASLRDGVPIAERADNALHLDGALWYARMMDRARVASEHFWNDLQRQIIETRRMMDEITHRQFGDFVAGIDGVRDVAGSAWKGMNSLFNGDGWTDSLLARGTHAIGADTKKAAAQADEATRKFSEMFKTMGLGGQYNIKPGVAAQNAIDAANNSAFLEQQHREEVKRAARYGYAANGAPVDQTSGYLTPDQIVASANAPQAIKEVSDLQLALDNLESSSMESLKSAAHSLGDAFVDAFTRADFSASEFFKSLGASLLKQGIGSLISFGFDAWSPKKGGATGFDAMVNGGRAPFLPGFATGGDMLVSGAGGTDSRIAAFRVTPGESIHVRTPQQRAEASASMAPRTVQINIPGNGNSIREEEIEGLMIRIVEQNAPAFRRRLGLG